MSQPLLRIVAGVLAIGMLAAGCGGKRADPGGSGSNEASCEAPAGRITIATGNAGGVVYTLGGGLAQLISDNTDLKASGAETGGSVQNIQQLVAGDYDLAIVLADNAADAVTGKGPFEGKPAKVQSLARLYENYTHVLVRADAGITSLAELRGKRVSTGSPKSGTESMAHRLLWAAGLDPEKDIQAQRLDVTKTADAMKNGTIDALIWSGGLPTAHITDITNSLRGEVKFLDVTSQLDRMKTLASSYDRAVIPAATYQQPADMPTIVVPIILLVRENFPFGSACAITKLVFDKTAELAKVHPAGKDITLDRARQTDPVELHPGASRALDELGG